MNLLLKLKRSSFIKNAYKLAFRVIGWLPVKRNLIMFESFLGKQYSDNPRAIYEYLKNHYPEFQMYWSVDKRWAHHFESHDIHYAERFTIRWLFLMARARYWVTNSRMPLWIPKPAHTIYLQTWHGTPLKKLAADIDEVHMPGTTTEKYKKNFYLESRNWDYLLSPNAYSTRIFKRAFRFNKKILESGYPRNDYLNKNNNRRFIDQLKKKCRIPLDKKVILYAPTFRDDEFHGRGRYKFDLGLDLKLIQEKLDEKYVVVLRMHYLVADRINLSEYDGFAFDFSDYEDIRDLYLISDVLITDYSSVFFDYANLWRPIIFYVYDIDSYRDKLRGFYFDIEKEAPGPLVKTTAGLIDEINSLEKKAFTVSEAFEQFYNRFCYLEDGGSSQRVVYDVFLGQHR